jgi:hypothetical protein
LAVPLAGTVHSPAEVLETPGRPDKVRTLGRIVDGVQPMLTVRAFEGRRLVHQFDAVEIVTDAVRASNVTVVVSASPPFPVIECMSLSPPPHRDGYLYPPSGGSARSSLRRQPIF